MHDQSPYIALIGNPNSGKTAIFNLLTGMNQKVSNYPGITVEKKRGIAHISSHQSMEIWDLPGAYSLIPESMDEHIVSMQVLRWMQGMDRPRAIISVVDSCSLSRNLYLTSQLLKLNIPIIIALNMMDRLKRRNQEIDVNALKNLLGVAAVVPMSAREKWGIEELKSAIVDLDAFSASSAASA